jgi:hypothetical protein
MELIDLILIWIQKVINEMVSIPSDVTRLIRSGVDSTRSVGLNIAGFAILGVRVYAQSTSW